MRNRSGYLAILMAEICMSALMLIANSSWAAEWWLTPSVRLGEEYNDNIILTTVSYPTVYGTLFSPRLDLGVQSDIWQVSSGAEVVRKNYSYINGLDRDDEFYTFSSQYKTERATWHLDGNLSHESVLADKTPDSDTGLSSLKRERKTSGVAPSWTWMMTERTQLQLGYQLSSVSYVDGLSVGFYDYTSRAVSASISNQLSLQDQVFATLSYSNFDVPISSFESKTTSIQGGMTHAFSDSLRTTLLAGIRETASDGIVRQCIKTEEYFIFFDGKLYGPYTRCRQFTDVTVSQRDFGSLFSAKLEKQFEITRLSISLSRSLVPSGSGTPVQTETLDLLLNRPFTPMLTGILSVNAYDVRSNTANIADTNRTLYQAEPKLRWQWTEEWLIDMSLRYSHLKRSNDPTTATGSAVFLTLRYQGPRMSISR